MRKMLIVVSFALAGLAALPAVSSATLYSGSTALPVGSTVKGSTNSYIYFEAGYTTFNCTSSTWESRVLTNNSFNASLATESWGFHGVGKEGMCQGPLGNVQPIGNPTTCWTVQPATWYLIGGQNCGRGQLAFTLYFEGFTCKYKTNATPYSATTSPVTLTGEEIHLTMIEGGAACAGEGLLRILGWNITDESGNPLTWK